MKEVTIVQWHQLSSAGKLERKLTCYECRKIQSIHLQKPYSTEYFLYQRGITKNFPTYQLSKILDRMKRKQFSRDWLRDLFFFTCENGNINFEA